MLAFALARAGPDRRPRRRERRVRSRRRILAAALLAALLCAPLCAQGPLRGWQRFDVGATGTYALRYVPFSLDLATAPPAVVFLHGSGAFPESWQFLLAPVAEVAGVVLVLPKSASELGFGVGADNLAIAESLHRVDAELSLDPTRIALAGHSSGGAYAAVLLYAGPALAGGWRFSSGLILGAPYRTVLTVADPDYAAPIRMVYGTEDPNFFGGSYQALAGQWERLGVPWEEVIAQGFGHSSWPDGTLEDGFAFLASHPYSTAGGCLPAAERLCLAGGRFAVEATWRDRTGRTGPARVTPARTADSGLLYFFRPGNWELQVKVLNGCPVNGRYWVFAAGTTDVAFTLTVTDLATGQEAVYENPLGTLAGTVADTAAFDTCP